MLHTQYADSAVGDIEQSVSTQASTENFLGLHKQSIVYDDKEFEPFRFEELAFFSDALEGEPYDEVEFEQKYKYKPQYIAKEFFGNPRLGYIILYFNRLTTISDFTPKNVGRKIKVPKLSTLLKISDIVDRKEMNTPRYISVVDQTLRKV